MLLWTWLDTYLFKILLSIILSKSPEMELMDYMVIFKKFLRVTILFFTGAPPFYIATNSAEVFQCIYILTNTYFLVFFL